MLNDGVWKADLLCRENPIEHRRRLHERDRLVEAESREAEPVVEIVLLQILTEQNKTIKENVKL